jgi:hypothetical protein
MKLTIISQNLQGLNDPVTVGIVKNYFRPLLPSIDILYFQKHKLKGNQLVAFKIAIWPRTAFYTQEATLEYMHTLGQPITGRRRVCMWVGPTLQYLVVNSCHSLCGQA